MRQRIATHSTVLRLALALPFATAACADESQSLSQALLATTPLVDVRLRHEEVEQTGIAANADANTLRARLGAKTGEFLDTSLLVEGEAMTRLDRSYRPDNSVPTYARYPLVADPDNLVVNRLQLSNRSLPQTTITVGRQVINLDDQRFVGNTGWRQNEVTFDAVRMENRSMPNLDLDLTVLDRVNRIYGQDSPQGAYKGNSYLINAGYRTPIGTVSGFAYLLDFNAITGLTGALDPRRGSTSTVGGRLTDARQVSRFTLGYTVSYASQKPRDDNPLTFRNDYFLGELKAGVAGFTLALGDEILHGNGIAGFTTPLATLHGFQGWADKFVTTPANGIDDRYGSIAWSTHRVAVLNSLSATAAYHDFSAERLSAGYGREWDLMVSGKWHDFTAMLKYADYMAAADTPSAIATATEKFWAQLEYVL